MKRFKFGSVEDRQTWTLFSYWMNAEVMRAHFVDVMEEYEGWMDHIEANGEQYRFCAYMGFWFAALFVVVEGFNRCGFKDARVQRLFTAHMGDLKNMRHEMFHFMPDGRGSEIIGNGNWASELHEAIGEFISEHASLRLPKARKMKELLPRRSVKKKGAGAVAKRKMM